MVFREIRHKLSTGTDWDFQLGFLEGKDLERECGASNADVPENEGGEWQDNLSSSQQCRLCPPRH